MQITEYQPDSNYRIKSCNKDGVTISNQTYKESLIVTATSIQTLAIKSADQLTAKDLQKVIDLKPEVLLIGTGEKQQFLANHLLADLINQQIGTEVMNTAAACRTFNVLLAESRNVAVILIVEAS